MLDQRSSTTTNVEPAPFTAQLPKGALRIFDAGLTARLAGPIGVGLAVTMGSDRGDAVVLADVPHPFFFDQPRQIQGTAFGVDHQERAVHLNLVYLATAGRVDIALSGGVTMFSLTQDLVTDIVYTDDYPFDTAAFSRAALEQTTASTTGYNAGMDVAWMGEGGHWGLGGLVRYARGSVDLAAGDLDAGSVDVGGLQLAGGLRLKF
jgi:hypothetical protein